MSVDDEAGVGTAPRARADLAAVAAASYAKMRTENFPVALRILPARPRDALTRVYRFARFVDDVGDTAPGDRLALLDLIAADVRALPDGSTLAAVRDLAPVDVPAQLLLDLVEANRLDQRVSSYETFADLRNYCRLSARPIGRIVLHIAGVHDPDLEARSDAVCDALQVLEHCQDVGEDARAGRVYLPAAELRAAGVDPAALCGTVTEVALRAVVATQVSRASALLAEGTVLVRRLRGWARLAVAGYVAGGRATADALARADYDVLARPVTPSKPRTALHLVRVLAGR